MTPGEPAIRNPAKEKLANGGAVLAFNVFESLRPSVVKIVAQLGFDLLLVETEHILHDPETLTTFLVMARDNGLTPIVTIPGVNRSEIGRLLDAGALGFCLCHAERVEQVEDLVRFAKYPPLGVRALAHGPGANYWIEDAASWRAEANQAVQLILKIESAKGDENAEAMMAVAGVDAIVFGPGDLAADMGTPGGWDDPGLLAAMESVVETALARGMAIEAAVGPADRDAFEAMKARGIQIFGPARMTEYDHLRAGATLALAPYR